MTETPQTPSGPGWYDDPHDPLLLRYFDGVVWSAHTTPRRSPTADSSTIGRATPGTIPGRAGDPGAWAGHGQPGPQDQQGPGQWQGGGMPPVGSGGAYGQVYGRQTKGVLPDGAVLAEWWRRLVGRILDIIVTSVITVIVAFPFLGDLLTAVSDYVSASVQAAESGAAQPNQSAFTTEIAALALPITIISMVVSLLYETAFLTWRGATPGKMVVGTLVRRVEGPGRLDVVTALKRQVIAVATSLMGLMPGLSILGSMLSIIDPAWLLWDPKRQALHDKVADTVVVLRTPRR